MMPRHGMALMGTVLLLAACGGGGGGGGSSGGASPGPATAQGGFTVPTTGGGSVIAQNGSGGSGSGVTYTSPGTASASITVDGVTRTWSGTPASLGSVDLTTSADGGTLVITAKGGANAAGGGVKLAYSSYGVWLESSAVSVLAGTSEQVTNVKSFVVGNATPVNAMPSGGTASYQGEAVAVELRSGASPRPLSGAFNATANFASGQVTATADLRDSANGSAFGNVAMNALAINGNQFGGGATSTLGHAGTVKGGFTGPNAAELGGTFELNGPSTVHGAFAGKK